MKKITKYELLEKFRSYNRENGIEYGMRTDVPEISGVIVYKQSNFTKEYSEVSRSYRVTNLSGKACFDGMMGNSLIGDCLDGTDQGVRLDAYNWDVEYCYLEKLQLSSLYGEMRANQ